MTDKLSTADPSTRVDKTVSSTNVDDVTDSAVTDIDTAEKEPRRRVAPLAPDERRAAIIEATLPLLLEHGTAVSTRQIAAAAGIAEGTIFRVFPDKGTLIRATVLSIVDPKRAVTAIEGIDPAAPLRERLTLATEFLVSRIGSGSRIHTIAREIFLECGPDSDFARAMNNNRARVVGAIADVMLPDRDRLRVPPLTAAHLLMSMVIASHGHMFADSDLLAVDDIVTVLLDGLVRADASVTT